MTLGDFLDMLEHQPDSVSFDDTLAVIDRAYAYTPTAFCNGDRVNQAGENVASCKILAFARLNRLSEQRTLHCFGHHYRHDVLGDPQGSGHQNIRQFMQTGWAGVEFEAEALVAHLS